MGHTLFNGGQINTRKNVSQKLIHDLSKLLLQFSALMSRVEGISGTAGGVGEEIVELLFDCLRVHVALFFNFADD
jgi:hypothetical protein